MKFVKVAQVADVPTDEPMKVEVDGTQIALVRCDGDICALSNICTHEYAELHEGFVENGLIECPLHGSEFDLRTGEPRSLPATKPLQTFPVKVDGDDVLVGIEE
jgi:3-phenylpropionate/trans-cinnamate dioxygenase ferredoxin subunit